MNINCSPFQIKAIEILSDFREHMQWQFPIYKRHQIMSN